MRLRANFRDLRIPNRESEEKLLTGLITSAHRYYLEEQLKVLNIPGRTKIHKAFGWGLGRWINGEYVEHDNEQRALTRTEGIRTILDNSTLLQWIEAYARDYTLKNLLEIISRCEINLDGMNIGIERVHD